MKKNLRNVFLTTLSLIALNGVANASCVNLQERSDGGTGFRVTNNCGRAVTVVVYGDGTDYRNLSPGADVNWTTSASGSYKVCPGFSNISC